MARKEPKIADILHELAEEYHDTVAEHEICDRVLARRPSSAKNPCAAIQQQIRMLDSGWITLGNDLVIPERVALRGLRFRLTPSAPELAHHAVLREWFRPFVSVQHTIVFVDTNGQPVPSPVVSLPRNYIDRILAGDTAYNLQHWFASVGFQHGDSLLLTIIDPEQHLVRIEHEPAAAFQAERVAAQDTALINALRDQITRPNSRPTLPEKAILPIYARAAWRTAYPGRQWQHLVINDPQVRLGYDQVLDNSKRRNSFEDILGETMALDAAADQALLDQITALQEELRLSRRDDAERGLWDGLAPRVSTAQTLFDMEAGTSTTIYPGAVDALQDHTSIIEEHIANGDYEPEEDDWSGDENDLDIGDDAFDDVVGIEDVQEFVEQNPEIAAATRRLMDSLSPAEQERLDRARSVEDVQQVLAPHLASLLQREPALFTPLTPDMYEWIDIENAGDTSVDSPSTNRNHSSNRISPEDMWMLDAEEDEDEPWEGERPDSEYVTDVSIEAAAERSSALLDMFIEHQINTGKSQQVSTSRAGDMWLYADFLARYYGRTLEQADYATLDECLFFFYPRKVMNSSPRNARDVCISAKQFFAFLKAQKLIENDGFAQAIWQRRDQAARVVELYDQIDSDSPQFERLFAHLFSPYTV